MKQNTRVKVLLLLLLLCAVLFIVQELKNQPQRADVELEKAFLVSKANFCVICQNRSTFVPFGRKQRICPFCFSHGRHRLLFLYLQTKTTLFKENLSLLHFAPQECLEKKFRNQKNLQYITAELYVEADLKLDIRDINLPDNTFDVVLCLHVLEHVVGDKKAINEIFRILKPGGWAILQVPLEKDRPETYENWDIVDPKGRLEHFGQEDHVRFYGWRDYKDRLEKAGFIVNVDNFVTTLDKSLVAEYGLIPDEDIYVCSKSLQ